MKREKTLLSEQCVSFPAILETEDFEVFLGRIKNKKMK